MTVNEWNSCCNKTTILLANDFWKLGLCNVFGRSSNTVLIWTGQVRQCSTYKQSPEWLTVARVYFLFMPTAHFGLAAGQLHMIITLIPRCRVTEQSWSGVLPAIVAEEIENVATKVSTWKRPSTPFTSHWPKQVTWLSLQSRRQGYVSLVWERVKMDMLVKYNTINHKHIDQGEIFKLEKSISLFSPTLRQTLFE